MQLDLFDPDAELSAIGITRLHLRAWRASGLIHFDPETPRCEHWMLREAIFVRDLMKVEWSCNALRQLLASLQPPYDIDHGREYFNFRTLRWERRYEMVDLLSIALLEQPKEAGDVARALIRRLALAGARSEVFKTLAVLREVVPDDWLKDVLPDE